jgi:rubrerythrin
MFNKEDYLQFIDELFKVEKAMEEEGRELLAMVDNEEAKRILNTLINDEIRHQGIVKEMRSILD